MPDYLGLLISDDAVRYHRLEGRDATPACNASTLQARHQIWLGMDCLVVLPYHQPGNALWDERGYRWFLPAPEQGRPVGEIRTYHYDATQVWLRNSMMLGGQLVVRSLE